MPKISVIVPVYNVQEYLTKCVDSILIQDFRDFELILIDDGSTDQSGLICENYLKMDGRVKVIHKENGGLSDARNVGLDCATGDFVTFIDSDDYIEYNYLERLYNESCNTDADVVICNFYRYYDNANLKLPVIYKKSSGLYSSHDILKSLIPDNLIHSYLWNKLWKKDLFDNLEFPDIKYEDIADMCDLFYKAKKISYYPF